MNKFLRNVVVPFFALPLFFSCSKDDVNNDIDASELNSSGTIVETADITATDLEGRWEMYSMTSTDSIDFDKNGVYTYDLLEETNCFDAMYFDFDSQGNVNTHQARLYFNATSGKFSCQTTGDYSAKYMVTENELTVTFVVGGQEFTEIKTISLYNENGSEFLEVTLTKAETTAAVYVANDPGNTVVSDIQKINMTYKKQ